MNTTEKQIKSGEIYHIFRCIENDSSRYIAHHFDDNTMTYYIQVRGDT